MQGLNTRSCQCRQSRQLHFNQHYGRHCRHVHSFQLDILLWGPSTPKLFSPFKRDKTTFKRAIPRFPERILDAPGLRKDPLTSPISWCQNKSILAVALGCCVYIWEERNASICSHLAFEIQISAVHWITSSILAIGSVDGTVVLWEPFSHGQIYLKRSRGISVNSIASGPCGTIAAGDSSGDLFVFFSNGTSLTKQNAHLRPISFITFEQKGLLATADSSGIIHLWKIMDSSASSLVLYGSILKYINYALPVVKAIGWCPWRSSLIAAAGPSSITLWNAYSGSLISEASLIDHSHPPLTLHWWHSEASTPLIVLVHSNYEISIWSLPRLLCVSRIRPEMESVIIHTCWTGSRIISIAADERIQFHSLSSQQVATNSPSKLNSPLKSSSAVITSPIRESSLHTIPKLSNCKERKDVAIVSPVSVKKDHLNAEHGASPVYNGCGLFSPESRKLLFGINGHGHWTSQ